jgi:uncharacterized damage-inducible protein DinB
MRNTIAEFSQAVRASTLKRLQLIPDGLENWKISENAMSIADIAQHLVDTDKWLFQKLVNHQLEPITGKAGSTNIQNRSEYDAIIDKLEETGETRHKLITGDLNLDQLIYDSRFNGQVTALWIILRGNLDHEIHHRGQLTAYIRALQDTHAIQ